MSDKAKFFKNRFKSLTTRRVDFEQDWKDISKFLSPSTGIFDSDPKQSRHNKRSMYHRDNMNGNPQRYMRDLGTALVATLCPPDARWFGYRVEDMTREEQSWLYKSSVRVLQSFNANGVSSYLNHLFYEGGVYGIGTISLEKSRKTELFFQKYTIGEYFIGEDSEGIENILYRRFTMNADQLQDRFGYDSLPQKIKDELDKDNGFADYNIIQAVEPNRKYLPAWKNEFNKPFVSCIWIEGIGDESDYIQLKGMDDFPFIIFHWYSKITSVYTMGIGHDIIGDVKELQEVEKDTARARKKNISPPLKGDPALRNAGVKTGSNDITWTNNERGISKLYDIQFTTEEGLRGIDNIERRLRYLTFKDLFSYIMSNPKTRTAEEVKKISQEEIIMLGGIVQNAMLALDALCSRGFKLLLEQGLLPPNMPETLKGKMMTVSFHSLLAQAQSLSGLVMVERWLQFVSSVSGLNPLAARKPDILKIVDDYAKQLDIDSDQIISTEEIEAQVEAEAEAAAAERERVQQIETEKSMSEAVKNYAAAGTTIADMTGGGMLG